MSDHLDQSYIDAAKNRPNEILWYNFTDRNGNLQRRNMKNKDIIVKNIEPAANQRLEKANTELEKAKKELADAETELADAKNNIININKKPLEINASYNIYMSEKLVCDSCVLNKKLEPPQSGEPPRPGGKSAKQRRKTKTQNKGAKQK